MERRIVHPCIPGLQRYQRGLRNQPPPLLRIEEHKDEEDARDDKPVNVEKVPRAGNADGMPVALGGNHGRDIARIVLRGPDPIRGDTDRREPNPRGARRAVIVEVEARVIDQDRQTAPDQHHHENKVEEVAVAHPQRKAMWASKVVGIDLRDRRNIGESNWTALCAASNEIIAYLLKYFHVSRDGGLFGGDAFIVSPAAKSEIAQ